MKFMNHLINQFLKDHEVEVSKKLSEIGHNFGNLISSINKMEKNILNGLNNISTTSQFLVNKSFK